MGAYIFSTDKKHGFTPIPNLFISEYMPSADGNFVKVFLLGLFEANNDSITGESLSKKLGLIESDIIKAWEYWESKGLVRIRKAGEDTSIDFIDMINVYPYGTASETSSSKYSPEFISSRMSDPNIKDMYENIEKFLGRTMSSKEISMYLSWLDDYLFSPEVIILLIEYCKSKGKVDSRYIEAVALKWHDSGITTARDAQRQIAQHEEKYNRYRLVVDFLGLKEGELMKPQEELLDKWFNTWEFSLELVLEACKICSLRINEPNFSYIDGILSNWYKKGVKSIKEIEIADPKKRSKNVKFKAPVNTFNSYDQRSYNIGELEKKLLGIDEEADDEQ